MGEKHFTYSNALDNTNLKQGDILKKTDKIKDLLQKYHSYYATSQEYTHFQVLTQSCDLIRRGSNETCTSRYITLAAVRSLDTVIKRAVEHFAEKRIEFNGNICCSDKHQDKLSSVLSSLFNNQDKEYFFLKASPEDGLIDDSCTFLHLSIAIRANDNYSLCLEAKALELQENFRARLGWMVGNLYSRVGTEDYVPGAVPDLKSFDTLILDNLNRHIAWVPHEAFSEFKQACKTDLPNRTLNDIIDSAKDQIAKKRDQRNQSLVSLLRQKANLTPEQESQISTFLNSKQGSAFLK